MLNEVLKYLYAAAFSIPSSAVDLAEVSEITFMSNLKLDSRIKIVSKRELIIQNKTKKYIKDGNVITIIIPTGTRIPIIKKVKYQKLDDLTDYEKSQLLAFLGGLQVNNKVILEKLEKIIVNFSEYKIDYIANRLIADGRSVKQSKKYAKHLYKINSDFTVW